MCRLHSNFLGFSKVFLKFLCSEKNLEQYEGEKQQSDFYF